MKNFLGKLKSVLDHVQRSSEKQQSANRRNYEIFRGRKEILKCLQEYKDSGRVIGFYCSSLGDGMFLTGVEDISRDGKDVIVAFRPYDIAGNLLQRNYLSLSEINGVCPFAFLYRNPVTREVPAGLQVV